jgi:hypothetical protein
LKLHGSFKLFASLVKLPVKNIANAKGIVNLSKYLAGRKELIIKIMHENCYHVDSKDRLGYSLSYLNCSRKKDIQFLFLVFVHNLQVDYPLLQGVNTKTRSWLLSQCVMQATFLVCQCTQAKDCSNRLQWFHDTVNQHQTIR